ncbi:MAG: hypothetical protein C0454_11530 [Parvibaculum sp.]|nr:hypothetical protein [Parvibaculum sp.]
MVLACSSDPSYYFVAVQQPQRRPIAGDVFRFSPQGPDGKVFYTTVSRVRGAPGPFCCEGLLCKSVNSIER